MITITDKKLKWERWSITNKRGGVSWNVGWNVDNKYVRNPVTRQVGTQVLNQVRTQIISDTQDAINWDFLLTKTKESRMACVEAMRIKVGQYMRLGTITLEQTQDFYTSVYQLIIWFDQTNKPDFKQWISNEVGSPYELNGFAQKPYYTEQIKDDLMEIYNGNY